MRRWWWGLMGLAWGTAALAAEFPTNLYNHVSMNTSCNVQADCGVGSEALCLSNVCYYSKTKIENVADEVEAIEAALCTNMSCVLDENDIDTAAEIRTILDAGEDTGTGPVAFGTGPTLSGPVLVAHTVDTLPAAGSRTGAVYVVTDSLTGTCATGGGSKLILCRDNGASYTPFDANNAATIGTGDEPYCMPIDNLKATFDHKMIVAWPSARSVKSVGCRCNGDCDTLGQLWLADSSGNPIGSAAVTCGTGNISFTDVSSDTDGDLASGEPLFVSTPNSPSPETDEYMLCVTFE